MKSNILNSKKMYPYSSFCGDMRANQSFQVIFDGADALIAITDGNIDTLTEIEKEITKKPFEFTASAHLIVKAALSKVYVMSLKKHKHLEIIIPMYHEKVRISPRLSSTHNIYPFEMAKNTHGENALLRKVVEMEWLTKNSNLTYRLLFVDDMCDHNSGKFAEKLIKKNNIRNCEVFFLDEAIKKAKKGSLQYKAIETIIEKNASIRGGALCLGFSESIEYIHLKKLQRKSIIGYVDADSSYSLTQIGIPFHKLTNSETTHTVTASRQHELTYLEQSKHVTITSSRSAGLIRLKQIIGYLRKQILGNYVPVDTQSGFKLFKPKTLEKTLRQPNKAHNFSYDTQLLSRISEIHNGKKVIDTFGVVCLDCDELTTANNNDTYFHALTILQIIAYETNVNQNGPEAWLLNYLTKDINNYKTAIALLENDNAYAKKNIIDEYILSQLEVIKQKIETGKDTTAVGNYFSSSICSEIVSVFKLIENEKYCWTQIHSPLFIQ